MQLHRPRPAVVLATVAVFAALATASDAASTVKTALFAKKAGDAKSVGGIRASKTPKANRLLPLGANGKLPASVIPAGSRGATGPQGPKGDRGDRGATGDTGPQGPGAVRLNFDSTTINQSSYTTLGTVAGVTISARCTGANADAATTELALSGATVYVGTTTVLTDFGPGGGGNLGTPDPSLLNSVATTVGQSGTPVNVLTEPTASNAKPSRVVGYHAVLERPGGAAITLDLTIYTSRVLLSSQGFRYCHVGGTATPTS